MPTEAISHIESAEPCTRCAQSMPRCECVCGACHAPFAGHAPVTTARERMVLGAQVFDIRCWNATRALRDRSASARAVALA